MNLPTAYKNFVRTNTTVRRIIATLLIPFVVALVLFQALRDAWVEFVAEVRYQAPKVVAFYRHIYTQDTLPSL